MCRNQYRCLVPTLVFASSVSFCVAQAIPHIHEKKASYFAMQVPGALGTYPMALNDSMTVTGYYLVSPTVARAFIQDSNGVITTFSVPNSLWTEPESINTAGNITGFFEVDAGVPQGFLRYANGRLITFNPPAAGTDLPQALPVAINDFDEVAGNSTLSDFTRSRTGEFNSPGYTVVDDLSIFVTSLNGSGTVVGYNDLASYSSFILHPDGFLEEFDVPLEGASCNEGTIALSVNAGGAVAGWFSQTDWLDVPEPDCNGTTITGGFVRSPEGLLTLFETPGPIVTSPVYDPSDVVGALSPPSTLMINVEGIITGSYTDANLAQHGFVRETDGLITSFDPPRGRHTTATGINASGVITGSYFFDWNAQTSIGFLRIPIP